jgi:hypothetical protein
MFKDSRRVLFEKRKQETWSREFRASRSQHLECKISLSREIALATRKESFNRLFYRPLADFMVTGAPLLSITSSLESEKFFKIGWRYT